MVTPGVFVSSFSLYYLLVPRHPVYVLFIIQSNIVLPWCLREEYGITKQPFFLCLLCLVLHSDEFLLFIFFKASIVFIIPCKTKFPISDIYFRSNIFQWIVFSSEMGQLCRTQKCHFIIVILCCICKACDIA
ncbi:hypothetical protein GDO78_002524 [Eleutherodactylus coqui]|uniref:Uncharacterized protein n=1 Tax=Eleutherodactylus coqui TaxID=57060 RepID=A0A8J6K157_ELECQ|nr:hypothetical protein GDO78_002524 [Eleutherodactylus coqui]